MSMATTKDSAGRLGSAEGRKGLHRYALALVALTLVLIVAGGNVTSKKAGLAVPDWPLSFNSVNPPGWTDTPLVRDEHGHRLIGAAVGLATIGLVVWLVRAEPRRWVRGLGIAALIGVVIQGVMGGLRVILAKQGIDTGTSITLALIHGCFAQAFFCLTIAIALVTSPRFPGPAGLAGGDEARNRALRTWTAALAAGVFVQLILGALLRHVGGGHAAATHVVGALVVGAILIMLAQHVYSRPESQAVLSGRMIGLFMSYGLQLALGIAAYVLVNPLVERNPVTLMQKLVPTLHVAVGAGILGMSFAAAFRAQVLTRSRPQASGVVEGVAA